MKNFTLSLIAIIAMSLSVSAQNSFGVKAGANISSLSWNEKSVMSDDSGIGYSLGVMYEYIGNSGFGLDVSAIYSNECYKTIEHRNNRDNKFDLTTNFMRFPIHFKWVPKFINGGKKIKPILYTGPEIGWILIKTDHQTGEVAKFDQSASYNWNFGVGAEFINKFQITVQYGMGLNKMFKYNDNTTLSHNKTASEARANNIAINFTWLFR